MMKMVVNDGVFTFIEIFSASGIDTGTAVLVLTLLTNIVFGILTPLVISIVIGS